MTNDLTDRALEVALARVANALDWPAESGDLSRTIGERLRREPRPEPWRLMRERRRRSLRPVRYDRPAWQLAAAAVLAAVVVFSGVLAVSPAARDAVAGWFGLRGIEIKQTPTPPPAPTRLIGAGLDLGRQTTLREAGQLIGFAVRVPSALGDPDAVFVNSLSTGQREVFLVYRPRPGMPESLQTGVGALLSEFRGGINRPFVRKIAPSSQVSFVRVNGNPGFWIQGAHDLLYLDRSGNPVEDTFRLSGSALIWEQEGIVFRLESALSLKRALAVARGL